MTLLVPALAGALVVLGLIGVVAGLRRTPVDDARPGRRRRRPLGRLGRRQRWLLAGGLVAGAVLALASGWLLAMLVVPAATVGLPALLAAPEAKERIARLEAMEEWTRSLSGVLVAGAGLEQAILATLRSAPDAIRPELGRLAARLRARWSTDEALRAFADELDDPTGDLIAANLILGARRRGPGLAAVLDSLAESVAADVRARRQIEADREKPRTTARWVTIITVAVLTVLAMSGSYVAPYRTPVGELILAALLGLYAAVLAWMRRMAAGEKLPRFLGSRLTAESRP